VGPWRRRAADTGTHAALGRLDRSMIESAETAPPTSNGGATSEWRCAGGVGMVGAPNSSAGSRTTSSKRYLLRALRDRAQPAIAALVAWPQEETGQGACPSSPCKPRSKTHRSRSNRAGRRLPDYGARVIGQLRRSREYRVAVNLGAVGGRGVLNVKVFKMRVVRWLWPERGRP
jgi:hypothetical protein